MKWASRNDEHIPIRLRPSWKSEYDKPWEAAVEIAILAMMVAAIVYIGENAGEMRAWLERMLEALS